MPGSGWPGVGREVTHEVLYWSCFFYPLPNGVAVTRLQVLLGELVAHALHSPNTVIRVSTYFCILLFGLRRSFNLWNWLCCPDRHGLTVGQCWESCVEGDLWWNTRACVKHPPRLSHWCLVDFLLILGRVSSPPSFFWIFSCLKMWTNRQIRHFSL